MAEYQVNTLTHALDELAGRFNASDPDSVEFHASVIYNGKAKPWDSLKQPEERREVLKNVLQVFKSAALPAFALACVVHKESYPGLDPMEIAFTELCTRFDDFLRFRHASGGPDEKGIIFLDESTYETSLRQIARNFRRKGLTSEDGRYIVDGPHFVKSKTTRCVQLADHVAYAAFRYFHAQDNNYLSVILNRFQSDGKTLQGLRHMEANISECTCPGCLTMRASAGTLVKV